ncbi:glutamate receptor ionotropic, kainate 2-like isoform X1 [Homarus americanus]|uniref:glutamate receptor ionotropic, kainate 2-like isoform X1 n=1 Tax=Homarus americanus TaxID=6706 RepID=UPI001C474BFE|nr:glutamate receptor ionotropic, kainate 2-like isoform X1 [Homarus americanus]XP_042204501.1 glutamate receptor ionotropic, kainate 2-like isoform X1 [Homarus americanus]
MGPSCSCWWPRAPLLSRLLLLTMTTVLPLFLPAATGLPPVIRIGAMFTVDQREGPTELAFKYAVYRINKDSELLPNTTLVYDIQYVPRDDSFHASKKACEQIYFGVQAVFGPSDPLLGSHIQSICDALDIPHLEARLDLEPEYKEFSINLHPSHEVLNRAFQDVMAFLNWTEVAIIYEEDLGLVKLQELVKSPPKEHMEFLIRQGSPDNYRDLLKEIKNKEIFNIIVDTKPENMNYFLRGILQLQMNDFKYHYLFTTFDIETFDLEDFKYNFVNMTAFRLVDSEHYRVRRVLKDMEKFQPIGHNILNQSRVIQVEPALIYDSVHVFALGLQALERSTTLKIANLSCENELPWGDGSSLFNYINSVEFRGITGPIQFKEGRRTNFKLDILKLKQHSLVKVGEWGPGNGVNITDRAAFYDPGTMNVTLLVTTNLENPYVMLKHEDNLSGNARYEGFCIDMLKHISGMIGFQYQIRVSPSRTYGIQNPVTGEWNGIVRELQDSKADLAIGSMTINYARENVIDFTKPFMNVGISILFKVPTSQQTRLFSFMNPLAIEIWLYVLAAYILVSITMFIVARFSPYEWYNPHPCAQENDVVENQFSLSNSFWFTIGTLMQQGSDLNPKACSTRIVGGIWWFFTLIIISSYTANLAAFLTVERMITPIEGAEDLASQTEISYGSLGGGTTLTFFRDSKIETYQKMWRFMENKKPSVFVQSYDEGIRRVLEGNYAFLMESSMLDYYVQRNCNLTQIGGLLDSKSYGIATPMGSPWRDKISLAILELQEKGVIQVLYNRWWKNTGTTCNREDSNKESKASALGVDNIGGVFVVLLCGLAFAVLIAILEFCWNAKRNAQMDRVCSMHLRDQHFRQSLCAEMAEELCFAMRCRGSRQRPALRRQCSRCVPGAAYVPTGLEVLEVPHINGNGEKSLTGTNDLRPRKSSLKSSLPLLAPPYDSKISQNFHS